MNLRYRILGVGVCTIPLMALGSAVRADSITGVAYSVSSIIAGNTPTSSTLASAVASGTQIASFSATNIRFSGDSSYTLGGFLNAFGAAFGITFMNGASASTSPNNTLWVFTGTASFTNGQMFNVVHDDGTEMYINGLNVVDRPGPTPPVTATFTYGGPTGNFAFQFIYTECCGGSMDYITKLSHECP